MEKNNSTRSIIKGLIFLIAIFVTFVLVIYWLHDQGLDLLIGLVIGLVPTFITFYQRKKERDEDYRNWLMQNKDACAIELVNSFLTLAFEKSNLTEKRQHQFTVTRIKQLMPAMITWASPQLINQWERTASGSHLGDEGETIKQGERLLRTVRKDLGHDDSKLKPGTLWAMLIKPDEKKKVYDACKGENYE